MFETNEYLITNTIAINAKKLMVWMSFSQMSSKIIDVFTRKVTAIEFCAFKPSLKTFFGWIDLTINCRTDSSITLAMIWIFIWIVLRYK
jgi:hypothetical protein